MIRHPQPGQRVQIWYKLRTMPHHAKAGTVSTIGIGKIRNVAVRLDSGEVAIVPRGNLRESPGGP